MKVFLIAALSTVLLSGTALARTTHDAKIKTNRHVTTHGYYTPGIPRHDPGRYSNLPGKDKLNSKAYIQDH
jgi:hypothetical protein